MSSPVAAASKVERVAPAPPLAHSLSPLRVTSWSIHCPPAPGGVRIDGTVQNTASEAVQVDRLEVTIEGDDTRRTQMAARLTAPRLGPNESTTFRAVHSSRWACWGFSKLDFGFDHEPAARRISSNRARTER